MAEITVGDRFKGWGTTGCVVTGGTYRPLTGATVPGLVVGVVVVLGCVDDDDGAVDDAPGSVVVVGN